MTDGNNSAPAENADTHPLSQDEIADQIGADVAASFDDEEQTGAPAAKTAEAEPDQATDEAEEKTEAEEEPEQTEEQPAGTVKLKDGSEVTLDEAVRGYMRQSDYTRKTQELSSDRKAMEGAVQRLTQRDTEVKQALAFAQAVVQANMPKAPDPSLLDSDPVSFLRQQEAFNRSTIEMNRLQQAFQANGQRLTEDTRSTSQAELQAQEQALIERLPALKTKEGKAAFFNEAVDVAGKHYGFSPDEIGAVTDHRQLLVLKDAMSWRKLQSEKMKTVAAAKSAPPMKATARQAPNARAQQAQQAAVDRLRKSGSISDAAAALDDRLFGL